MSKISLIAAVDENLGLGKDAKLLCPLPADLMYFKQATLGKPIIMGRKTFESIGRPLPGRQNIVLSRQAILIDGVQVVHSLEEAIALTSNVPEIMIIGGSHVFTQALPLAHQIYLTLIHHQFPADVFFPALDPTVWECHEVAHHLKDEKNAHDMTFYCYQRRL